MVLNPALYTVLRHHFGEVRVSSENEAASYTTDYASGEPRIKMLRGGEQYSCCCPVCGDTRFRFSVCHRWLDEFPDVGCRLTHTACCYNEGCKVTSPKFYNQLIGDIQRYRAIEALGGFEAAARSFGVAPTPKAVASVITGPRAIPLPEGFTPLAALAADHPAKQFVKRKYNISPDYLDLYGVGYTDALDKRYPAAQYRIIFPIRWGGELLHWQGRTILNDQCSMKWFMPPGFRKVPYNADLISSSDIPVFGEGIMHAIAFGPTGSCVFGKTISPTMCGMIAKRWHTAILAFDPETYYPDPTTRTGVIHILKAKEELDRYLRVPCKVLTWPTDVLKIAEQKSRVADREVRKGIKVPDANDIGLVAVSKLLKPIIAEQRRELVVRGLA